MDRVDRKASAFTLGAEACRRLAVRYCASIKLGGAYVPRHVNMVGLR
jgi:hypothetical protein